VTSVVVTSFSAAGERQYGRRMVASFRRYWPTTTPLVVYADVPTRLSGVIVRSTGELGEWMACRRRWAHDLLVQGRSTPERPLRKLYSYRYDARRFAVKAFVQRDAARQLGAGILTWLDGDTVTTATVPGGWAESLLDGADVAILGRGHMHPETGYVGFRIPEALPLLDWCGDTFASERFRELPGWTDCHVLKAGIEALGVRVRDLTTPQYLRTHVSHVWPASELSLYLRHDKGARKGVKVACSVS
jgi:hypothetical protein